MSRSITMIPARLGSQRLKKKNLELFGDHTLIEHAILKCKQSEVFDEIYVNSESEVFEKYYGKVSFDESYIFSIDNTNIRVVRCNYCNDRILRN